MHDLDVALFVVAGSALVQGLLSKSLKRYGLPDPIILFLIGVLVGPAGLGWLQPHSWGHSLALLEEAARLALAIGLMGAALRLPVSYIVKRWRSLLAVLFWGMAFMWIVSSALVGVTFEQSLGGALIIGAALTPTDPVVASSIVTGPVARQTLPDHLRHLVSAESGANDGLAYLFAMAGILILNMTPGSMLAASMLKLFAVDVMGALLLGALIGHLAGVALRTSEERDWIEGPSILMFTTALALGTLAGVNLIGSNGILAVFVAGLFFDRQVGVKERQEEGRVVEGIDRFFISPVLILLGMLAPWAAWLDLGWPALALVLALLILRRLPVFYLLAGRICELPRTADGLFAGWFGPMGVAALYYAAMAGGRVDLPLLWPVVSLVVTCSIFVHGVTAVPLSHFYARRSQ